MIKQAPLAFGVSTLTVSSIFGFILYLFIGHEFSQRIADYNAAKERYEATIKSYQAAVDLDDKRIVALSPSPGQPSTALSGAAARIQAMNIFRIAPDIPVTMNVYFQNTGTLPAIGPIQAVDIVATNKLLTDQEVDNEYSSLHNKLKDAKSRNINFQIQQNEGFLNTFQQKDITPAQDIQIKEGNGFLYTFILVLYKDDNVPSGKWRATEVCRFAHANTMDHICTQHNGTLLSD